MAVLSTIALVGSLLGSAAQASEASRARKKQRQINARNRRLSIVKNAKARRVALANQRRATGAIRAEAALSGAAGSSGDLGGIASVEAQTNNAIGQNLFEEGVGLDNFTDNQSILASRQRIENISAVQSVLDIGSSFQQLQSQRQRLNAANNESENFVKAGQTINKL